MGVPPIFTMLALRIQSLLSGRAPLVILLAAILIGASWFAYTSFKSGEENLQEKAVQKAAEEVAKSENPFQSANPLSGVKADPLEKTKKVLNPFE